MSSKGRHLEGKLSPRLAEPGSGRELKLQGDWREDAAVPSQPEGQGTAQRRAQGLGEGAPQTAFPREVAPRCPSLLPTDRTVLLTKYETHMSNRPQPGALRKGRLAQCWLPGPARPGHAGYNPPCPALQKACPAVT